METMDFAPVVQAASVSQIYASIADVRHSCEGCRPTKMVFRIVLNLYQGAQNNFAHLFPLPDRPELILQIPLGSHSRRCY
jgi:hypothetical protein